MAHVQSFWYGSDPTPYEWLAMKSFLDFGHRYTLHTYEKHPVPDGVELRDAGAVLPVSKVFLYRQGPGRGSVAGFSNWFRYRLLNDQGGWWVDTDVICNAERLPEQDVYLGWEEDGRRIASAVLKFPRGHSLTQELAAAAEAAGPNIGWGDTGPNLLTATIRDRELLDWVVPSALSYPIGWQEALYFLLPTKAHEVRRRTKGVPFLHLWNEVLRRAGIDKRVAPPPDSHIAGLFRRHAVSTSRVGATPWSYRGETWAEYSEEDIEWLGRNLRA